MKYPKEVPLARYVCNDDMKDELFEIVDVLPPDEFGTARCYRRVSESDEANEKDHKIRPWALEVSDLEALTPSAEEMLALIRERSGQ